MPTNPMDYLWPGLIAAQAIHVAVKLRIPDLLASGPKTIDELASGSGAHPRALESLLRALSTFELFARTPDGGFCNTPLTQVLRADHPNRGVPSDRVPSGVAHFSPTLPASPL